ncbi:hypothetical protein H9Q08_12690 [Chryseobacterium sp. PS-8]|uniref:DUF3108 domain-containing protein n=1 Tax=Chryseobacterium indicum TaxID=2766954 RepID=A0ABS9C6G0_9FLAO|nr:hypothetical protein [Chryseobacterium sp. PS-8]MCF2220159.1 hypothetical protein [Chryseobacterium sp. PS-8]
MRNLFKIMFVITLLFSFQSNAQLDTIKYLKQFEANKHDYIGKPFSKLLKKMSLKPQVFTLGSNEENCFYSSNFGFSNKNNLVSITVIWEQSYVSNPDFGINFIDSPKKITSEEIILKDKKIRDIIVFDHASSFFIWNCSRRKKKLIDTYQFLSDRLNQYYGLRFEDFLCKTRMSVGVQKFKNIKTKNKVYKTIFTMRSYKIWSGEEGKDVIVEIEWEKPIKANLFILNEGKLHLEEIRLMRDLVIKSIKIQEVK